MTSKPPLPDATRSAALRDALLDVVDLLRRRRAAQVDPRDIDDYVSLGWLHWKGGGLELTPAGQALCKQLVEALQADGPEGMDAP